jgi:hypothetical protein
MSYKVNIEGACLESFGHTHTSRLSSHTNPSPTQLQGPRTIMIQRGIPGPAVDIPASALAAIPPTRSYIENATDPQKLYKASSGVLTYRRSATGDTILPFILFHDFLRTPCSLRYE